MIFDINMSWAGYTFFLTDFRNFYKIYYCYHGYCDNIDINIQLGMLTNVYKII